MGIPIPSSLATCQRTGASAQPSNAPPTRSWRCSNHHIVAYVGVLPEHRGNGYIDGILAEGTRVLAEAGAPRIRASTDVGNRPMANAFTRAGYDTFQRLINTKWN